MEASFASLIQSGFHGHLFDDFCLLPFLNTILLLSCLLSLVSTYHFMLMVHNFIFVRGDFGEERLLSVVT